MEYPGIVNKGHNLSELSDNEIEELTKKDKSFGSPTEEANKYMCDLLIRDSVSEQDFRKKYVKYIRDLYHTQPS